MLKLTIELTIEEEKQLQEAANRVGLTVSDFALRRLFNTPMTQYPGNFAESIGDEQTLSTEIENYQRQATAALDEMAAEAQRLNLYE